MSNNTRTLRIRNGSNKLDAVLTLESPSAPLLVFAHGFAGNKSENGLFTQGNDYFVQRGFSVLRFDFQACGDNKGSFKKVRLHDLVSDVQSVFHFIKSSQELGKLPLAFVGFSLGAGIGLLAKPPVDAYVFWSPAIFTRTDMVPRYRAELDEKGCIIKGNIEVSKDFINDLDSEAISHALQAVTRPVLFIHGTKDQRIPHQSSQRAYDALQKISIATEINLISGGDHSFRNDAQFRPRVFYATLKWLKRYVPTKVRPEQISRQVNSGHLSRRDRPHDGSPPAFHA